MRPIYLCDLDAAVRVLLAYPPEARPDHALQIVRAARVADRYRNRFGKPHPVWGRGTLMSAVAGQRRANVSYCDAAYRSCLADLLAALAHQSA